MCKVHILPSTRERIVMLESWLIAQAFIVG